MIDFILWLAVGALCGWLASKFFGKGKGMLTLFIKRFGILGYLILGILGSMVGGFLFGLIGISTGGLIGTIVSSVLGAGLLIYILSKIGD